MPNKQRHAVRGHITATEGAMPTRRPRTSYTTHTIFRGRVCPGMSASVSASGSARPRSRRCPPGRSGLRQHIGRMYLVFTWYFVFNFSTAVHTKRGVCRPTCIAQRPRQVSRPRQRRTRGHARGQCAGVAPAPPQTSDPYGTSRFARYFASPRRGRASQTAQGRTYVHMLIRSANDGVAVT